MLLINDIPNFKWVLIHIGNSAKDTKGYVLVGEELRLNNEGRVINSAKAYCRIYSKLAAAAGSDEGLIIKIRRLLI
jgi:hypothetical protein